MGVSAIHKIEWQSGAGHCTKHVDLDKVIAVELSADYSIHMEFVLVIHFQLCDCPVVLGGYANNEVKSSLIAAHQALLNAWELRKAQSCGQ
jgi:hypothetical protein